MSADIRTALNCLRHPSRFMGISRTQLSRVHTGDSIQNISKHSKCVPGTRSPRESPCFLTTRLLVLDNRQSKVIAQHGSVRKQQHQYQYQFEYQLEYQYWSHPHHHRDGRGDPHQAVPRAGPVEGDGARGRHVGV